MSHAQAISVAVHTSADAMLHALPHPVIMVSPDGKIANANVAAEQFFEASIPVLRRHMLRDLVPFGSPLLTLIEQVRQRSAAVNEYKVDLATPRNPGERLVDLHVAPLPEYTNHVVVMLQERTIADKMDRQLTHRGAARSVIALAAMLAHEIKNPLSGIRGAAQLLEQSAGDDDRSLTKLICDETDRIVKLVDRMEVFADERPVDREPVNIHVVLDHVKRLAQTGFARHIKFVEEYDPSLPPILANRDQLIQVILAHSLKPIRNLVPPLLELLVLLLARVENLVVLVRHRLQFLYHLGVIGKHVGPRPVHPPAVACHHLVAPQLGGVHHLRL